MALFSFGKKDKKPPEVTAPATTKPATPPKIQNPPATGSFPPIKPPQATGLMPSTGIAPGTVTTQPMSVPRSGSLKPRSPSVPQQSRTTQRIVLPSSPGQKPNSTRPLTLGNLGGRINLPIGMILRCLPTEVLAADVAEFEANGSAATEIGLPMQMILGQLPSGKVEMTLQDLIPHFPSGFLQPTESITHYLPTLVSLPLMDVVMRIPPDLLALRPDQKDVDSSVINMADPFTEEILREQAASARRKSPSGPTKTNIIEESQAPQEEFVPRDRSPGLDSVAPPRRSFADPLMPLRAPVATQPMATPMPQAPSLPTPPISTTLRTSTVFAPTPPLRPVDPESVPAPIRSTTALPSRLPGTVLTPGDNSGEASFTSHSATSPATPIPPVPPVPRHTGPIPAPPPPRHTTSLPTFASRTVSPTLPGQTSVGPAAVPTPPVQPAAATPPAADANADDLQRLAALAMAQLGDRPEIPSDTPPEAEASAPYVSPAAPEPMPVMEPIRAPAPAPVPEPESAPEPSPTVSDDAQASASVAFNLNTCTADDLVHNIPDCSSALAESIIQHRTKIGSFKRLEDLLDVPGITKETYTNLTGEAPPANRLSPSLNEILGFPTEQQTTLKDVTDRIACWPDITGCVLSQNSGLSLVGTVPPTINKEALVAFAPRMFDALNKSFSELAHRETDALIIPTAETSFHLFRSNDLYLIIMSRLPQMPERHMKVARIVLAALSNRRD
jgi:DNA uptake protein ComE-like DNA-binding protein